MKSKYVLSVKNNFVRDAKWKGISALAIQNN